MNFAEKLFLDPCHFPTIPDFTQIISIAVRKILVLSKYFLVVARKILILPNFLKLGECNSVQYCKDKEKTNYSNNDR